MTHSTPIPTEASRPVSLAEMFGVRSAAQVGADLRFALGKLGRGFQVDASSLGHFRPVLSLRAFAGHVPKNGLAPIMNLFDRVGGGRDYSQRVTKRSGRDFRGGTLTYDEHDGTDFVCPVGTVVVAAAPGVVALRRDRWLRGGLTLTVDHGGAVTTQYSHLARALVAEGTAVRRGEPIAISGASGLDLTLFFPWVPPHVHFMVWFAGVPVDPFLAEGEERATAVWTERNVPRAAFDEAPAHDPVIDCARAAELATRCTDPRIRAEIARAATDPVMLAALLEDSIHHDRFAWPAGTSASDLRIAEGHSVRLTLPLDPRHYRGAQLAER